MFSRVLSFEFAQVSDLVFSCLGKLEILRSNLCVWITEVTRIAQHDFPWIAVRFKFSAFQGEKDLSLHFGSESGVLPRVMRVAFLLRRKLGWHGATNAMNG